MKAGISIRDITPKGIVKLGGYPDPADRCGRQTHDPLYSSAYYLQSDGKEFLLFCNDIIYFNINEINCFLLVIFNLVNTLLKCCLTVLGAIFK